MYTLRISLIAEMHWLSRRRLHHNPTEESKDSRKGYKHETDRQSNGHMTTRKKVMEMVSLVDKRLGSKHRRLNSSEKLTMTMTQSV